MTSEEDIAMMPPTMLHDAVRGYMEEMERNRVRRERVLLAMGGDQAPPVEKRRLRFSRILFWTRKTPLKPIESAS
jgi:hypothetical protein